MAFLADESIQLVGFVYFVNRLIHITYAETGIGFTILRPSVDELILLFRLSQLNSNNNGYIERLTCTSPKCLHIF